MIDNYPICFRNSSTCKLKDLKICAKKKMDCELIDAVAPNCVNNWWL